MMNTEKKIAFIISGFVLLFAYGIYNLFQPERFPISFVRGKVFQYNEEILIGPYPSKNEMLKLRRIGVEVFINLMNPAVPLEGPLIKEQFKLCKKLGVTCKNFPLSFLRIKSNSNKDQIESVIQYISVTPGKKYIHCYLGRHRVKLIKDRLEGRLDL